MFVIISMNIVKVSMLVMIRVIFFLVFDGRKNESRDKIEK